MAECKHTPGPWNAVKAPHGPIDIFDANGHDILTIFGSVSDPARQQANARLIAAAPCMKKHGQFLLDRLDEFERELADGELTQQFLGHVEPAIARLRAALASSEGRSHD